MSAKDRQGNPVDPTLRQKQIEAVLAGEVSQSEAARELGVSRQIMSVWVKKHKAGDLVGGKVGRPRRSTVFKKTDKERALRKIRMNSPQDLGIGAESSQWTPELVQEIIKKTTGLDHPIRQCAEILEESGMGPNSRRMPPPPEPEEFSLSDASDEDVEMEMIREKDLGPYIEKINEARRRMKTPPPLPVRKPSGSSKSAKKKRKAQKKARRKNR